MPVRVSPTSKVRAGRDALFTGEVDLPDVLEQVARLGARLITQTAVEAEVEEFLGCAPYERQDPTAVEDGVQRAGSRNGYRPTTVKTTSGPVTVARPRGPRHD